MNMIRKETIFQCDMCGKIALAKFVGSILCDVPDGWKRSENPNNNNEHFCPECAAILEHSGRANKEELK